ncbi:MAG: D-alanine--D-alanine ligase [Alphaproteobacteria bacterium]
MKHVAVLKGGWSAERAVSLVTGDQVAQALERAGYRVTSIDLQRNLTALLADLTERPDVVFNALHGRFGEDGCIQGVLEILGIPYTHSGVRASAMAMDKPAAKRVFEAEGIRCPQGLVLPLAEAHGALAAPYVVKPAREGSSVGVVIVRAGDNAAPLEVTGWSFGTDVLVERYVPGRELTVGVMDDRPLAVTELRPLQGFYDYEAKYTEGKTQHLIPAPIPAEIAEQAMDWALRAHRALGCRGVSRADFRYDDTEADPGVLYMLEVNTQPGLTPLSLVPEQAAHRGIDFPALCAWMVEAARCDS